MKTILENYGEAILSMVVILALIAILMFIPDGRGNVGIFEIMGVGSHMDTGLYEHMTDTNVVVMENSAIKAPHISYNTTLTPIKANQSVTLSDWFLVVIADTDTYKLSDASSNSDKFYYKILSIEDIDGNDYTGIYNPSTLKIIFPQPGIYEIEISCDDLKNGKNTISKISIPVDNF